MQPRSVPCRPLCALSPPFSVGYDHVAVAAASARGIVVCNTPGVLSVATGETAMLLVLAAARRAGEGERLVRSGQWQGWAPTQLHGTQVSGKRLGIFGMGRIGRELARMARAFDMQVHYRDQARLPAELEQGAIFHDSDESFLPGCAHRPTLTCDSLTALMPRHIRGSIGRCKSAPA
jgi:lactate dehydrogenase-like 2-hydroxyacid dehydrogenase